MVVGPAAIVPDAGCKGGPPSNLSICAAADAMVAVLLAGPTTFICIKRSSMIRKPFIVVTSEPACSAMMTYGINDDGGAILRHTPPGARLVSVASPESTLYNHSKPSKTSL